MVLPEIKPRASCTKSQCHQGENEHNNKKKMGIVNLEELQFYFQRVFLSFKIVLIELRLICVHNAYCCFLKRTSKYHMLKYLTLMLLWATGNSVKPEVSCSDIFSGSFARAKTGLSSTFLKL